LVAGDLRRVLDVAVEVIAVPNEMALAGLWALVESRRSPTSDGTCSCTPGSTRPRRHACPGAPGVLRHRRRVPRRAAETPDAGFDELSHRMVAEVDGAELMRTSEETSSSRTAPREGEGDPGKDARRNRVGFRARRIYRCAMASERQSDESVARRYAALRPYLDERQRRLLLGAEAAELGRGGIKAVALATGVHPDTVAKGVRELEGGVEPAGRVRAPGGGRKPAIENDPGLAPALRALVDPQTRGDPTSPLVWTTKSTRNLADALAGGGHRVSDRTVARMLRAQGFSLQANAKVTEGRQHVDRDAQFGYLNAAVVEHLAAGAPVVSVDTKKKELVGEFHNGGREDQPQGSPVRVNVHDFPDKELGKAIPYGIYDVAANTGWVSVGSDHDTSAFAVETLRRWWNTVGRHRYPHADRLLICADGGGSNGYRVRAWKIELARFAAETGLTITVCHLPPGTSKWNKIEHRLFSQITLNWRGRPLTSHQIIVDLIGATSTVTGLTVRAELDTGTYPIGVTYTKKQVDALPITGHDFHSEWNYTVAPAPADTPAPT
jgi:hypothetical protein